jgi:NTP pyrophosphatase (non-canonical NTP hydrolase)
MNNYQQDALQFALPTAFTMEYLIPALAEEAGEVCGLYAKHVRAGLPDHHIDKGKLKKELGDVLWNISCIAAYHGMSLQDVADANIAKLTDRKERNVIQGEGSDR